MEELTILTLTAASIAFLHTLFGPDHYIPFIALAKVQKWSLTKTTIVTVLCGAGHIMSSVLLGIIGIALGLASTFFQPLEQFRGSLAAWSFMVFGVIYLVWGYKNARNSKSHVHTHPHEEGLIHKHDHIHRGQHIHVHQADAKRISPWVLFIIFGFGPCEPLIPVIMYPAMSNNYLELIVVTGIFGIVTVVSMLVIILGSLLGLKSLNLKPIQHYNHVLAGATLILCGVAMEFFGM